jgi:uncharacterized spore protein YtfJ
MANLVEKVAELVRSMGVTAAYGTPVSIGGVELVPVALVHFGFGAGGAEAEDEGSGSGGGGGGVTIPVGAYTVGVDGPTFRPNLIALLGVAIPLTWVAGRALTSIIKALKK